jgi:hypothetical protein
MVERRLRIRFPLALATDYQTFGAGGVLGRGQTINVSSSGALVLTAEHVVCAGKRVQMNVAWPTSQDNYPLELIINGRVVRNKGTRFAVKFTSAGILVRRGPRAEEFRDAREVLSRPNLSVANGEGSL